MRDYSEADAAHWLSDLGFHRFIAARDRADEPAQEATRAPETPAQEGAAA